MTPPEAAPRERDRDQMLIEAGMALASDLDLDAILQRIVRLAAEITGARYAALGVLGSDGRIERFVTEGLSDEERAAIGDPPTGHGVLGLLMEDARPLRIDDVMAHERAYGFPANHPPMHSFLGAPVKALGRVYGNIYLTEKQGADRFDEADEAAVVVLATQAGIAIENARLYQEMTLAQAELRRLEVLEERERIAKELHDGVIQSLFAVGMELQGAAALTRDDGVSTRLEHAVDDIDRAIRDLRNYIFGLRPGILADRQLDQALRDLCGEFEQRTGVVTVADIDGGVASELTSRAAHVVQMAREALSNVGRHAGASTCRVSLRRTAGGEVILEIDDDGVGFDPDRIPGGMGLENLRSRVETMGGELSIRSVEGEGSTLTLRLPTG